MTGRARRQQRKRARAQRKRARAWYHFDFESAFHAGAFTNRLPDDAPPLTLERIAATVKKLGDSPRHAEIDRGQLFSMLTRGGRGLLCD